MTKSIITRLYIGFAVAIILVVGVGLSSYQTIKNQAFSSQWVKHTYEVMNTVKGIQTTIPRMRSSIKNYFLTNDERFKLPFTQGMATIFTQTEDLKKEVIDNPLQVSRADTLIYGIKNLVFFWNAVKITDTTSNTTRVSLAMAEEAKIDFVYNVIEHFYSTELTLLHEREKDDAAALGLANKVLFGGIALTLFIVLVLIYLVLRELRYRTYAEDGYKRSIEDITRLNKAADKRNWHLMGMAKINDSLQGNTNTRAIINSVLFSITNYLDLPAAALYLADEDKEMLELAGSLGVPADKPKSYIISQLPGGVPPENEIKIMKNVPAFFWQLQSSLGAASPGEVAIIPLYFNGALLGAIELANFGVYNEEHIELFKAVSNNISLALNTALTNDKLNILLAQLQDQKEALENQQEELRQSNEELTRQTEVLHASEEELKVQEEELRHINTELEEKNEAVETARQALQEKARELDEISRYKSEFLANMSHELRTPLNSILILANMLADNKTRNLTEKQVEYSGIIHKSGTELLNLINDILDLSKIEAGKLSILIESTSINSMVEDVTPPFTILAANKKLNFNIHIAPEVPATIQTDKQRLEQIIKNLLSNAFKFTREGGTISLSLFVASGKLPGERVLCIAVRDNGVGIPADKQRLIFEAFQQADGSTSRKYGGTGLGLSISRELIRILGGQITVESEENVGSTFTIRLPLQAPSAIITPIDKPVQVINTKPVEIKQQTLVSDDRDNIEPGDKIMLIIEDDTKFAFILQAFARERNYKTIIAVSGDEGLECASKYMPSAIILDIQLPVLDGWSVLKALKGNAKLKNIPVHIISVDDSSNGEAEGAIAYLRKPVTREGLEKAFSDIAGELQGLYKKILFYTEEEQRNESLQKLLDMRKIDATVTYAYSLQQTIDVFKGEKFNCIIVDIGSDIQPGIEKLNSLKTAGVLEDIQTIICLDSDISREDEWKLKKFSNIVIRNSALAQQRLMDELELFLYKIQQTQKAPLSLAGTVTDNDVFDGKKVLLVDDDMRNVFALSVALEEHNITVVTASDGREAIEVLKQNKDIALVLMDIMMPEMDGYEAMQHIRKDMHLTRLPIIALTAKAMQGDREKTIEAGASDYITKPVDTGRLLSLMRVWLSQ